MSEFSPRPLWQVPAAALGAMAMIMGAFNIREDKQPPVKESLPEVSTTVAPTTSTSTIETTTTLQYIGPAERLEEGFLVDNIGLRFNTKVSRGVDCLHSYNPKSSEHSPQFNQVKTPLELPVNASLLGRARNIMFLGEETSEPRLGNNKLSHGWAIEHPSDTDGYIIHKFEVRPSMGSLRGEAIGQPIVKLAYDQLRAKTYNFENDDMEFSAQIVKDDTKIDEFLQLTLKCQEDSQS